MTGSPGSEFVFRPLRVRQVVVPVAVALVVVFVVVAVLLRNSSTGVYFSLADQVAMVMLGLLLGGGVMLLARPRVRADADGVEVRTILAGKHLAWAQIHGVSFPDGAPWARLDLPRDEYVPVVAIQAADGERAVRAMRELRALYRASREHTAS